MALNSAIFFEFLTELANANSEPTAVSGSDGKSRQCISSSKVCEGILVVICDVCVLDTCEGMPAVICSMCVCRELVRECQQ